MQTLASASSPSGGHTWLRHCPGSGRCAFPAAYSMPCAKACGKPDGQELGLGYDLLASAIVYEDRLQIIRYLAPPGLEDTLDAIHHDCAQTCIPSRCGGAATVSPQEDRLATRQQGDQPHRCRQQGVAPREQGHPHRGCQAATRHSAHGAPSEMPDGGRSRPPGMLSRCAYKAPCKLQCHSWPELVGADDVADLVLKIILALIRVGQLDVRVDEAFEVQVDAQEPEDRPEGLALVHLQSPARQARRLADGVVDHVRDNVRADDRIIVIVVDGKKMQPTRQRRKAETTTSDNFCFRPKGRVGRLCTLGQRYGHHATEGEGKLHTWTGGASIEIISVERTSVSDLRVGRAASAHLGRGMGTTRLREGHPHTWAGRSLTLEDTKSGWRADCICTPGQR